jgi:cobalamin biosynthesis protein CobT
MKNTMFGFEMRHGAEQAIHKFCSAFGRPTVTVNWSRTATTAGISAGGDIVLPDVRDDAVISKAMFMRYVGYALHELAHHVFTDFNVNGGDQYLRSLHNAVEDIWIERQVINQGLVGNALAVFTDLINPIVDESMAQVSDWSDPRQYPFTLAVHGRRYANKVPTPSELIPIFDKASLAVDKAQNSADTLKIAQWVYDQLQKMPESQDNPKASDTPSKASDGPTSPSKSDGEGEGAGDKPSDQADPGPAKRPAKGQDAAQVEPTLEVDRNAKGIGSYNRSAMLVNRDQHMAQKPYIKTEIVVPGRVRYEVKKLFENTGFEQFQIGRKAGSLNINALHTVPMGNERVFKRRQEVEGIDSAAVLVLDISGSMFGNSANDSEIGHAVRVLVALMDTLHKANVSTMILAFGCETSIIKPWDMNPKKAIADLARIACGGGTNDYFAVRTAHDELLRRPEQRKICFVMTDGDGDVREVKRQVKSGNALGITTVGVGIGSGATVSGIYDNPIKILDMADLGNASFKRIKLAA